MKSISATSILNPYYVFVTGSLGAFIIFALFTWNYPQVGDQIGTTFVQTSQFVLWEFLLAVFCCMLTILFLPLWGLLFRLIQNWVYIHDEERRRRILSLLAFQAILLGVVVFSLLRLISTEGIEFDMDRYVPRGHSLRMNLLSAYTFLTTLPGLLGMILIHSAAQELSQKIDSAGQAESKLFPLIGELLPLRNLLQNYLIILGVVLSMIPVNTAGLRAILIALDPANEQAFPITNPILFGLLFTMILLLIYVPTHLALTETSRKLRDRLCPLDSMASLKTDMDQRKALDELLQTNVGVTQNLKTGLITLAPLVTSLISSVLKVNLPL